jgi:hypothetical protein
MHRVAIKKITCLKEAKNLALGQGCQMVYFQTKNPNLGKFFEGLRLENVDIYYVHL